MKKHDDKTVQPDPKHNELVRELEETKKQVDELKNKYLRALADYQNLERRTQEEKYDVRKFGAELILARLLPVVDTFKKVKEHIKDPGFDLAYKELHAVLQEQGVEHIVVVGQYFNPHEMECVEVIEGRDNIVMEETMPGYRLHGKILRVAQVKVGRSKKESTNVQSTNENKNN